MGTFVFRWLRARVGKCRQKECRIADDMLMDPGDRDLLQIIFIAFRLCVNENSVFSS